MASPGPGVGGGIKVSIASPAKLMIAGRGRGGDQDSETFRHGRCPPIAVRLILLGKKGTQDLSTIDERDKGLGIVIPAADSSVCPGSSPVLDGVKLYYSKMSSGNEHDGRSSWPLWGSLLVAGGRHIYKGR